MSAYAVSSRGLAAHKLPQGVLATIMELLFSNSEQGIAKLDFSDFSGMYQDRARTIPFTAVGQLLGSFTGSNGVAATAPADVNRGVVSARVNLLTDVATLATQSVTVAAGNYVLSFTGAGSVTLSGAATGVKGAGDNAITCTSGSLTLTVSGAVNNGFLRTASNIHLPFQWVNSSSDYDTAGFPHYLEFNGTNTNYVTPSIDFSGTDKITVWAGVTKLSDATGMIVELGSAPASSAFLLYGKPNGYDFFSRGSLTSGVTAINNPAPVTNSIACIGDISGDIAAIRINSTYETVGNADQGSGNYRSDILYIGARAGTSLFFNGRLYSLIARGAQSSQSQIEATELYIKQMMRLP